MGFTGFTGISFPFRVNSRGGVAMSSTSVRDVKHIDESIQQALRAGEMERPMEQDVTSALDTLLFEPNDLSLQAILSSTIVETLENLDPRIEVEEDDIEYAVEEDEDDNSILYATITYRVIKYDTYYESKVNLGEVIT